jgi:hypothetical protein
MKRKPSPSGLTIDTEGSVFGFVPPVSPIRNVTKKVRPSLSLLSGLNGPPLTIDTSFRPPTHVPTKTIKELIDDFKNNIDNQKVKKITDDVYRNAYNHQKSVLDIIESLKNEKPKTTHRSKKIDIYPNPRYNMYVYKRGNSAYKVYNYERSSVADFAILREIIWQKYAYSISQTCKMKVPKIQKYGHAENKYDNEQFNEQFPYPCFFLIQMKWIDMPTLKNSKPKKDCESLATRVNNIQTCMETNGLHHNDYHHENILLGENGEIGVIDFGRSNYESDVLVNKNTYRCDEDGTLKTNRTGGRKTRKKTNKKENKQEIKRKQTRDKKKTNKR